MRLAITTLALAIAALVSLGIQQPERAGAEENLSGAWIINVGDGSQINMVITQTNNPSVDDVYDVLCTLTVGSSPNEAVYMLVGNYDPIGATLLCSGNGITIDAIVANAHSMSGTISTAFGQSEILTATGGSGDPKLDPTPAPVGGLAFDARSDGGSTFDASWLVAIASAAAAVAMLGSASLLAHSRQT